MKENSQFIQRIFMKFFLPSLLSSLGLAIGAVADCVYVGQMMNEEGLYIIGVASPIYMIFTTWSVALALGGSIHFSQALGEGDAEKARGIFLSTIIGDLIGVCALSALGLLFEKPLIQLLGVSKDSSFYGETLRYVRHMLLCCPVLFMQAPMEYFVHADDDPNRASRSLVFGCIFDCLSGYLLIVVGNVGVVGSVWSTLVGALVMEGICLCHFIFGKGSLRFPFRTRLSVGTMLRSLKTGFATATRYLYQFLILLVFNRLLFGICGESAVAIYDISLNVVSLSTAVIEAVVLSMLPMISTFFGERNQKDMKLCLRVSVKLGLISTGGIALLLMVSAPWLCGFLGLSAEWMAEGAYAVRLIVLSSIAACLNNIFAGFFQNVGKEKVAFLIVFFREFLLLLICGCLFAKGGLQTIWYAYPAAELLVLLGMGAMLLYRSVVQKRQFVRFDEGTVFAETFSGSCTQISDTCERLQEFLERIGASERQAYFVTLAVDEICRLIAENTGNLLLQLTLVDTEREYVLHIRDNARCFNPFEVRDDDEHGLGLKLVKKQTKEYYYRQFAGFNTLTMSFEKEG